MKPAAPANPVAAATNPPSATAPAKADAAAPKSEATAPKAGAAAAKIDTPRRATAATPRPAAAAPALPTVWDLPYATRKDIPEIELSMHVYSSDPKQRFVVIKGERHVEGDELSEDLVLREIRQDGIVLDFKGKAFFYPSTGR